LDSFISVPAPFFQRTRRIADHTCTGRHVGGDDGAGTDGRSGADAQPWKDDGTGAYRDLVTNAHQAGQVRTRTHVHAIA
jgi:hypothetical protein